jgi:3-dehydroquinate synthase
VSEPTVVRVELGARSYDILIGDGLLDLPAAWEGIAARDASALIVTNTTVAPLFGDRVARSMAPSFASVGVLALDDGEAYKVGPSVERIVDELLRRGADRRATVVALGGGVVGDLAGFAAACYMRGIGYLQVPTTLLAQVDSSVGGKTAINHPLGKNMIGAFHQPRRVIVDIGSLRTLPRREFVAGLAEVIKYGAIADDEFLAWIEARLDAVLAADGAALGHVVATSARIKAQVVSMDEREAGARELLNFGHTFAHAIEAGLGFGTWLHGEAVGCGMVLAVRTACRLGLVSQAQAQRIETVIRRAGLPVAPPAMPTDRWIELMRHDKKARGGTIRLVLPDGAGSGRTQAVDEGLIRSVIESASGDA